MVQFLFLLLKLLLVQKIETGPSSTIVTFQGGQQGTLLKSDAQYTYYLRLCREGLQQKLPVAVGFDQKHNIVAVEKPEQDVPVKITSAQKGGVDVFFKSHHARFYLDWHLPDYSQLVSTLASAMKTGEDVWFAVKYPEYLIMDVKPCSSKKIQARNLDEVTPRPRR